jgi:hypothetical protein
MAQKQMLKAEVHARALRASKNVERAEVWARDAPDRWAGRGLKCALAHLAVEWKALVAMGWRVLCSSLSFFVWCSAAEVLCSAA